MFLAVQIDVPEGIPVDEVMKRFKNESRRVNTVGEVGCISTAGVTAILPCLLSFTLTDLQPYAGLLLTGAAAEVF